jgi:hypothetical protein
MQGFAVRHALAEGRTGERMPVTGSTQTRNTIRTVRPEQARKRHVEG